VGKTHLCRALARLLFGSEEKLIRLDMSEYTEKHSVSKLIGAPPGYVGFEEAGQLTEKVRRNPYSVVLFDEIEKAHPEIYHLLLQVLEDGNLTDSHGRRVDLKNCILILTSNCGAASPSGGILGFDVGERGGDKALEGRVNGALKERFPPEFLNRLDEIVVFRPLEEKDLVSIARKMLGAVSRRLREVSGIRLEFHDDVLGKLVKEGFDPVYGARPLRRVIQKRVEDSLSTYLLSGTFREGDKVLARLSSEGEIEYEKK
jgi:ATP-dependent Clp protease ATP-binding subunit ClpC